MHGYRTGTTHDRTVASGQRGRGSARRPSQSPRQRAVGRGAGAILELVNSVRYRNEAPSQIVPDLADRGIYVASESTIYRILRETNQLAHRGRAAARTHHAPDEHTATGPNEVWSWDISVPQISGVGDER